MAWLFLMMIAGLISSVLAVIVFTGFQHLTGAGVSMKPETDGDLVWISEILMVLFVGAILLAAVYSRTGCPASRYLGLRNPGGRKLLMWAGVLLLFVAASDTLLWLAGIHPVAGWMRDIYTSADCLPCLFIAIIMLAPPLEELVFRGFVFEGVYARLGPLGAVVLATAPWLLLHVQYEWCYLMAGLGLGLIFSVARLVTGSVYPCILMHGLANIIASAELIYTQA